MLFQALLILSEMARNVLGKLIACFARSITTGCIEIIQQLSNAQRVYSKHLFNWLNCFTQICRWIL